MTKWPIVPLGEVLKLDLSPETVQADGNYPLVGIFGFGRGLFTREAVSGTSISATQLFQVKTNQFVYSRLKAFEGAFGLVPEELNGRFVSNEFPTFSCDPKRLVPAYLGWYFRNPTTWTAAARSSTGIGARRERLKPEQLLKMGVPLPPLQEQRQLVNFLDSLNAKIQESTRIRESANASSDRLLIAMAHRDDLSREQKKAEGWRSVTLDQILTLKLDTVQVIPNATYPNLGIYSFGRGLFEKSPIDGMATSAKTLTRVHTGQFIYSRLFAFEGAYGVVPDELNGYYVSNEYPTFNTDPSQVLPQFLWAYFQSPRIWREVAHGSKGLGDRRQRVQPERVLGHAILLPPLSWQQRISQVRSIHASGEKERTEVTTQLAALMPSVLDRSFSVEEHRV